MKRILMLLPILALALPASVAAQQNPSGGPPRGGGGPFDTGFNPVKVDSRPMYEDIEVMRQLLARNVKMPGQCTSCHVAVNERNIDLATTYDYPKRLETNSAGGGTGTIIADFDGDGMPDLYIANAHGWSGPPITIEGTYLKGHGVVFNVNLPTSAEDELAVTAPPSPSKPASDWEQTRRQLRGEKTPATAPAKKISMADILLKTLAENGKNFAHLPANESLTVIVTFRGQQGSLYAHHASGMTGGSGSGMSAPGMGAAGPGGTMGGGSAPRPSMPGGAGSASGPPAGLGGGGPSAGGGPAGLSSAEPLTPDRELELLGDLHVKRGNVAEAASAYERAIKQTTDKARVQALATKLAEIFLKHGNLELARKALEFAATSPPSNASTSVRKEPFAIKLPGKLIVSASKNLLDQVGGEKISFADFQKQVSIEVQNFDAAKAK